jgi:antagonist of KipI
MNKSTKYIAGKCQIIESGFHDSIQDIGRIGFRQDGIPQSGAMDFWAYQWANWLVGNDLNTPVIEMTFKGGSFLFSENAYIACTGANMNIKIDGQSIPNNKSIFIKKGSTLKSNYAIEGVRTYLAIQGIYNIDKAFGSSSTYTYGEFGGNDGQLLRKGDSIDFKSINLSEKTIQNREIPSYILPHYNNNIIRVVKSAEWDWLKKPVEWLKLPYKVTAESNRMGIRLSGKKIQSINEQEMRSSGTNIGTIQLLPSGQLIVLMQDGQTTGGYPRIANVIRADLGRLAQFPPNSIILFRLVIVAQAQRIFEHKMAIFRHEKSRFLKK